MWRNFIMILLLMSGHAVTAQHQNIRISNSRSPEEPTVVINPQNTNQVIAGSNIDNVFYSHDGGYSWTVNDLDSPYGVWGDPVIIADTAGHFYYFHLSNPPNGNWIDRIVCQKSTDGGVTWSEGTYIGLNGEKAQDKHWAVVDRSTNAIYLTWTQFDVYGSSSSEHKSDILFSKSYDGGLTWSTPVRINEVSGDCIDSDNTTEGASPAVGPDGEIYVAWMGPQGIVFDRSTDEGESWLEHDILIDDLPGGWDFTVPGISRSNGFPVLRCDLSGGIHHGTLYLNWSDQRNGDDDTDLWLVKSVDGGFSWSEKVRVNDDEPGKHQFFTWMDIDQGSGDLWFVFYDRRNYADNFTDVYMALSQDGGATFTNFVISETPFEPWSSVFFGDYNNLSVHNGIVRPVWTRLVGGSLSVWTAIVDVHAVGEPDQEAIPFELEQNFPNPFAQTTWFKYKLRRAEVISLRVYDITGRPVATLIKNREKEAGRHVAHFDPGEYGLSSGIYYFSLETKTQVVRRKMVFQ
ncbi:MAG: T9SS type A sorting domain-containing protein [Bacteroidales bacterium]|nr:T9SS type A sorting domain-containing protein [Bacteroidales bacterium]MDD3010878.1 T9SS type A sorting domain-containing protein [Bacteroidales bacterium]MDD3962028.1 T9SS type A sorting domain-containing protein [Bacteroidales bacterium]MDY0286605.1 T9SS type A sorting domain-containing protein [Bacteroidales bacterium]HPE87504.1 T9SS type A sorting domain-containing protein [Bacteroidales bacterium]